MAEKLVERQVRIAGKLFMLRNTDVTKAFLDAEPEPITSHFVVLGTRRFPPKQVISALTGLDRADFTTHQARRTLMRLGFAAGRRRGGPSAAIGVPGTEADHLRPFVGQWVAIKDQDVAYAADSPHQVVAWLAEHGQKADSVFRVPEDEVAATGLAPL